jgi:hypothetical protein
VNFKADDLICIYLNISLDYVQIQIRLSGFWLSKLLRHVSSYELVCAELDKGLKDELFSLTPCFFLSRGIIFKTENDFL